MRMLRTGRGGKKEREKGRINEDRKRWDGEAEQ